MRGWTNQSFLGNSEEETADSESERNGDSSDLADSLHEQDHLPLSVDDVDWTKRMRKT